MIHLKRLFFVLLIFHFNCLFSQQLENVSQEIITTKDSIGFYLNKLRPISSSVTFSNCKLMRVSYVYLDGSKLNMQEISALRKKIIADYNSGVSFATLANTNTMDNSKDGDFVWFY